MVQILFVDDDPTTLSMLNRIAQLAGHHAHTAQSGPKALEMAEALHPDLIVLDLMMPDMDGLSVLAELQARPQIADVPVVVLSAGSEMDAAERALEAGAKAYLLKPISIHTLTEVIREHTEQ